MFGILHGTVASAHQLRPLASLASYVPSIRKVKAVAHMHVMLAGRGVPYNACYATIIPAGIGWHSTVMHCMFLSMDVGK